jgi:AraC family transcriptional regulator
LSNPPASPTEFRVAPGVELAGRSRFRHVFAQETGTSFRAYLLWLRINLAIEAAMAGASWTEAAHETSGVNHLHSKPA